MSRRNAVVTQAAARLEATIKSLGEIVLAREDLLRQIKYALVTKNHVLMEGPPGIAKSMLADRLFGSLTGHQHYFTIKCTKKMSEDYLVGAPNMRKFRNEGLIEHITDQTLVTSDFAFVDEFMDLTPSALRALLELLNERTFTRGRQKETSPLWTVLAATNFGGDNEDALEAVIDRFLFRCKVSPLQSVDDKKRMVRNRLDNDRALPAPFDKRDLLILHNAMKKVRVSDLVMDTYLAICDKIGGLTDRTVAMAIDVVRANAALEGRKFTLAKDLCALDTTLRVVGDNQSASAFAKAMGQYYANAVQQEERIANIFLIYRRIRDLWTLAQDCVTYAEIYPIAIEAREAEDAITAYSIPEAHHLRDEGTKSCVAILSQADMLHAKENSDKK